MFLKSFCKFSASLRQPLGSINAQYNGSLVKLSLFEEMQQNMQHGIIKLKNDNNYDEAVHKTVKILIDMSEACRSMRKYQESTTCYKMALDLLELKNDIEDEIYANKEEKQQLYYKILLYLGKNYYLTQDYSKAIDYLSKSILFYDFSDNLNKAYAYEVLARSKIVLSIKENTLNEVLLALDLYLKSNKNYKFIGKCFEAIALAYQLNEDYEQARLHFNNAINHYNKFIDYDEAIA